MDATFSKWAIVRLEEACSLITDGTHQTPTYIDDGVAFLSAKNVTSGVIDWENIKRIPFSLHEELHKRVRPQRGDVLLAKNGTTGVAALVDRNCVFDIYVSLALLRPKAEVLPEYLCRVVNSPITKRQFDDGLKGIGVPNLHLKEIPAAKVPLPPLPEQRRIAAILDKAEELRAKRRAALGQLNTLTQAIFLELFGDPMINPQGWKTRTLGDLATKITDGTHKTPIYKQSGVEFLSAKDLKEGGIQWGSGKFISEEEHQELIRRCNPELGDILLAKSGSLGHVAIIDRSHQFSLFESLCLIKHDRELIDGQFLVGMLRSPSMLAHLLEKNKGVAIKHLHLVDVRNLRIPLPPIESQRNFAQRVGKVEKLKTAHRASLAELDRRKLAQHSSPPSPRYASSTRCRSIR
ncbi:MAG TPA: restriction endonuclease subunit S [Planctomycetota bacterium]|nr:restriction endonuclease subunit S [Planctomycetota bacterium]